MSEFGKAMDRLREHGRKHVQHHDERGRPTGRCRHCELPWPCPTNVWVGQMTQVSGEVLYDEEEQG